MLARGGRTVQRALPGLLAFASVGLTAAVNGGYFPSEWGWPTLGFLLVALLAVLLRDDAGVGPLEPAMLALLGAFAVWTVLSAAWSPGTTPAVHAAELVCVYVAGLGAAFLLSDRVSADRLVWGVLAAAAAVALYALPARLAHHGPGYQLATPIGYWNALGILMAVGALAAVGLVAGSLPPVARAIAAAPVPLLLATLAYTYSRGSWLSLAAGLVLALAFARRRLRYLATVAALAPAAVAAALVAGHSHSRPVAGVVALCVAAEAGAAYLLAVHGPRVDPSPRTRRWIGGALAVAAVLVVAAGVIQRGGPVAIVQDATSSFRSDLPATGGDLNRRLLSLSGDGRGEYWRVAWVETRAHPVLGGGAGSYAAWWQRERHVGYAARNAHNLYLETLAELGPLGLLLLLAALAVPLAAAVRLRDLAGTGAYCAVLAHAALDWDWQLPAVTLAALFCGASMVVAARPGALRALPRTALVAALIPAIVLAVVEQAINT